MKPKKCKVCKEVFTPERPLQYLCGWACATKKVIDLKSRQNKKQKTEEAKVLSRLKESLLTHSDYLQMLQVVFNTFIRLRDKDLPCISCGTTKPVEYAAGHFYPTTYGYLRFNEDNVHKQCNKHCNMMLRGNLHEYKKGLELKIGLAKLWALEVTRHNPAKLSIPEIKEKIIYYKLKIKQLK